MIPLNIIIYQGKNQALRGYSLIIISSLREAIRFYDKSGIRFWICRLREQLLFATSTTVLRDRKPEEKMIVLFLQLFAQFPKAFQCALQILDNIIRQLIGRRQIVQIGERFVLDPEDVKACLVPRKNLRDFKLAPAAVRVFFAPRFGALIAVFRVVAGDEILQVRKLHRVLFQREVDIRAEVVDPDGLRLRFGAGGTLVKKDDVRFDAGLIKDAGRQAQNCMQICSLQQLFSHDFA